MNPFQGVLRGGRDAFLARIEDPPTLPVVTLTAPDPAASEAGPDPGAFALARTGSTAAPLTVNVTFGGTATPGTDYNTIPTPVLIPAGQAAIPLPVLPRTLDAVEGSETVVGTIAAGVGYTIGTPSTATVTVADGPLPPPPLKTPTALSVRVVRVQTVPTVRVTWRDSNRTETGFRIERQVGTAGRFAEIGRTGANVLTFTDPAPPRTTLFYRVQALGVTNSAFTAPKRIVVR